MCPYFFTFLKDYKKHPPNSFIVLEPQCKEIQSLTGSQRLNYSYYSMIGQLQFTGGAEWMVNWPAMSLLSPVLCFPLCKIPPILFNHERYVDKWCGQRWMKLIQNYALDHTRESSGHKLQMTPCIVTIQRPWAPYIIGHLKFVSCSHTSSASTIKQ